MAVDILFPQFSVDTDIGAIAEWLVADGASVSKGQVLFVVESDKASVEVEAPAGGTVRISVAIGEQVKVGQCVARIQLPGESEGQAAQAAAWLSPVNGICVKDTMQADPTLTIDCARTRATPLARRLASERSVDLSTLTGTGPRGRIQKRDVESGCAAIAESLLNGTWLQREGEGTTVLLHGFGADLSVWMNLFAGRQSPSRVFAIDLPGHGKSTGAIPASLDGICDTVEQKLRGEGIESALLMGHSFGGAVAARLASRSRIAVQALLLIAPAGLGPEIRNDFINGFAAARQESSIVPWLHELVHDTSVIPRGMAAAVERQRADDASLQALQTVAATFYADGTQSFSIREDLARLEVPARVLFGLRDRIIPFSQTRNLPQQVALHVLDCCGHLPYLEKPELTWRVLDEMNVLAVGHRRAR